MNRKNLKFYVGCLGFWFVMSGILFSLVWSRNPPVLETINVNSRQEFTAPKREVYEMKDGEKICYLTFDDGPSENTIKILDILKEYNAKATFFVIGNSICEENRFILERIIAGGHAIGLHAHNHVYEKFYANDTSYLKDYNKLYQLLKEDIWGVQKYCNL